MSFFYRRKAVATSHFITLTFQQPLTQSILNSSKYLALVFPRENLDLEMKEIFAIDSDETVVQAYHEIVIEFRVFTFASKWGSVLVKVLSDDFPLTTPHLHLKRIRPSPTKGSLQALWIVHNTSNESSYMEEKIQKYQKEFNIEGYTVIQVPKHRPECLAELHAGRTLWPLNFRSEHSRDAIELDDTEKKIIEGHMQYLIHRVTEYGTAPLHCFPPSGCLATGALVVHPTSQERLTGSYTKPDVLHPLKHSAFCVIEQMAERYRTQKKSKTSIQDEIVSVASPQLTVGDDVYLCTGLDVYFLVEPCTMCAMALVHSRVRRVYFGVRNKTGGALATHFALHTIRSLNHRYRVFGDLFPEECQTLMQAST